MTQDEIFATIFDGITRTHTDIGTTFDVSDEVATAFIQILKKSADAEAQESEPCIEGHDGPAEEMVPTFAEYEARNKTFMVRLSPKRFLIRPRRINK